MAFPTSPINGQIFKNYKYNTSAGAWTKRIGDFDTLTVNGISNFNGAQYQNGNKIMIKNYFTLNMSGLDIANYYPVQIVNPVTTYQPSEFTIQGHFSGNGGDNYNDNILTGWARGGGWTDGNIIYDLAYRRYELNGNECLIYGVYAGTSSFTGMVIYLRGGINYYVQSASNFILYTSEATLNASTFPVGSVPAPTNTAILGGLFTDTASVHYTNII